MEKSGAGSLPNLGVKSWQMLAAVGIDSPARLQMGFGRRDPPVAPTLSGRATRTKRRHVCWLNRLATHPGSASHPAVPLKQAIGRRGH